MQLIAGELSARDAVFYAQRNTRHYAKRQITWFRREREMEWLKGFGEAPHIREAAVASVAKFLRSWR
jgi:tRNA dimethylallyltransferase